MLSCEILTLRLEEDIRIKINNWFLLNKEKKVKFIQHTYITPVIIPIPENDPIRKQPGMKSASYTEKRGYLLVSIYYESPDM